MLLLYLMANALSSSWTPIKRVGEKDLEIDIIKKISFELNHNFGNPSNRKGFYEHLRIEALFTGNG